MQIIRKHVNNKNCLHIAMAAAKRIEIRFAAAYCFMNLCLNLSETYFPVPPETDLYKVCSSILSF